jgi:choline-glycine betaine transporter
MLLVGEGGSTALDGLNNLTILAAVPFTLVMIGLCFALMRDLRSDALILRGERCEEIVESAVIAGDEKYDGDFEVLIGPGNGEVEAAGAIPRQPGAEEGRAAGV